MKKFSATIISVPLGLHNSAPVYSIEDFCDAFNDYFLNDVVDETSQHIITEFKISEIHQNEIKGAPEYLLLNELQEDVEIKYQIYSKRSDGKLAGVFKIIK